MYFKSREAAGNLLASQIAKRHRHQKCTVVALNDGGVVVGMRIAMKLRAPITLLLTQEITLPRDDRAVGGITAEGNFTYNNRLSSGEVNEIVMDYRTVIEQEKMARMHEMHVASGRGQLIRRDLLDNRIIILTTDGLHDTMTLNLALDFLKPIKIKKLVVATPLANVPAVDYMHLMTDEIFCLSVIEDYMTTDHYYDVPDVPDHETVIRTIERVVGSWR